ncbi:MAG TPA: type II secretion system protein [Patescibacteria group bacterium]|jgi:prepilin-type N-terminal cleavage/methylation domain-containing protein|nr:type II secretion system protein [Patescibacteria group bacterium]
MKNQHSQSGFTLIELLVSIAIIGLLASLVIVGLNQTRVKARDAKRKGDLVSMQKALEIYYNTNSGYPCTGTGGSCTVGVVWQAATGGCGGSYGYTGATGYIPNLAPTFVGVLPADPKPDTGACTGYVYKSDGTSFKLLSNSAGGLGGPETFPSSGQIFYDPVRPTTGWMVCAGPTACTTW